MSAMFHKQHTKSLESRSTDYEQILLLNCDVLSSVEICSHLKLQKNLSVLFKQVSLVDRKCWNQAIKGTCISSQLWNVKETLASEHISFQGTWCIMLLKYCHARVHLQNARPSETFIHSCTSGCICASYGVTLSPWEICELFAWHRERDAAICHVWVY